ncbi:MAG: S8 family serine peptidase [Candidatus Heimdallarchaeota archaeon]|nr:S8 family serine peptidase [Candidatus Heimdallarchaeota archaeon]MCG3254873.1 S8 family serine peptidase [Candidatus Heimdallarchaeota archaeon]MCK4609948.1 S8 family serine peptidase [Candidatus Heimdallarchaeota archaeon]
MKYEKILSFCLIVCIGLAPLPDMCNNQLKMLDWLKCGAIGDPVINPAVKVGNLQDAAYKYTETDVIVYEHGVTIDDYVTVVIIDDGLTDLEWKALEQNPEANVDIVGFLTNDFRCYNEIKFITNPNDPFLDNQVFHGHGFAVISVLASIARDVKVIFIDLYVENEEEELYDPYGFTYGQYEIWEWIDDNQASKDIDIVSWSWVSRIDFTEDTTIHQKWASLITKNVMLLTAAGNYYNYLNYRWGYNYMYQSYYSEWYAVGSIDHEDRSDSWIHHKSWFSSWYKSYTTGNHIVNWVEPGNGIPILTDAYYDQSLGIYRGIWKYGAGTSFSTPYLAATIALIITAYHNGIGSSTDPSLQKVLDILYYASSRSTFDQKFGYGYIDAYLAFGKAYTEGRLAR